MRRRFFLFFPIFLILLSFSFSKDSIVVKNPKSGNTWFKGKTYTITWEIRGKLLSNNVEIGLYDVGKRKIERIITKNASNTGSYTWRVPEKMPSGSYSIIIKTPNSSAVGKSAVFRIMELHLIDPCKIIVTSPKNGKEFCKGDDIFIRWKYKNPSLCRERGGNVNVKIMMVMSTHHLCTKNFYPEPMTDRNITDRGVFRWHTSSLMLGGLYRAQITKNNKVYYSPCFILLVHCPLEESVANKIKNFKFTPIHIKVSEPLSGGKKVSLPLDEIINFLKHVHHSDFSIELAVGKRSKELVRIFRSRVNWSVPHKGNTALVNSTVFYTNGRNPLEAKIEIYYYEMGELLNTVKIIMENN